MKVKKSEAIVTNERLEEIFRVQLTIDQLTRAEYLAVLENVQLANYKAQQEANECAHIRGMQDL